MLEKVDLTKKISKEEYKEKMPQLEARLGRLQRECKALGIRSDRLLRIRGCRKRSADRTSDSEYGSERVRGTSD